MSSPNTSAPAGPAATAPAPAGPAGPASPASPAGPPTPAGLEPIVDRLTTLVPQSWDGIDTAGRLAAIRAVLDDPRTAYAAAVLGVAGRSVPAARRQYSIIASMAKSVLADDFGPVVDAVIRISKLFKGAMPTDAYTAAPDRPWRWGDWYAAPLGLAAVYTADNRTAKTADKTKLKLQP